MPFISSAHETRIPNSGLLCYQYARDVLQNFSTELKFQYITHEPDNFSVLRSLLVHSAQCQAGSNYSIENVSHFSIMDTDCCTLTSFTSNYSFHYNRNSRWRTLSQLTGYG
jgi:hypothetical protein